MLLNKINSYSFKYMRPESLVYPVIRGNVGAKKHQTFSQLEFYSVPMNTRTKGVCNVLLSYSCPYQAAEVAKSITINKDNVDVLPVRFFSSDDDVNTNDTTEMIDPTVLALPLEELKYIGEVLYMPTIVIMNTYCNIHSIDENDLQYELFYYERPKFKNPVTLHPNMFK